jgi:hypothetical protein
MHALPVPPFLAPFVAGMSIQETLEEGALPDPYKILPRPFPVLGFQSRGRIGVLRESGEDLLSPCGFTGQSGVTRYDVDLEARTITYRGKGEAYEERIPDVPAGS